MMIGQRAWLVIADNQWNLPEPKLDSANVANLLQIVFGVAGAITILLVVIGALKYVISQGDPGATAKAKDTILYALIGMALCVTAFSIVTFVVGRL